MKQEQPYTESEASIMRRQRAQSSMLLPPNINCNLTPEEENALAWQIAEQGDESATSKLYSCCLWDVYSYFHRKTWGDVPETENLTQETFVRAIQGLRNGSWSGQLYRPYLFGIARNVYFEWLRANPKRSASAHPNGSHPAIEEEHFEQVDLLDEVLMRERGTILWRLVQELPEKDQLVLLLRYSYGFRYAEIATVLKCKEQACKTRHWRALDKLREKILKAGLSETLGFGKDK